MGGLGLGAAYGATIERIKAQGGDKSRLGMAALMWISHVERPLGADELCHALAIELGSPEFNADNVPSISTLVGCCQGLITVDEEASAVRLIHFTLQDYLSTFDIFSAPHSKMAEICLTYLNSPQVKAIPADSSLDIPNMPFLKYCSLYWGVHAKRELSDHARSLSLELFSKYDDHISGKLLLAKHFVLGPWRFQDPATGSQFKGLHCASFFGIADLVAALIEIKCYDINDGGFLGHTPLDLAADNGHEEVVKILLGNTQVNPDKPNNDGRTPLFSAAQNGHEGVVELLLGRKEVNPDYRDNDGNPPLLLAAWYGHEGVVKILLGRKDVNPDSRDIDGKTPLLLAAWYGHEGVVKILLGRKEVNPDNRDNDGETPLLSAAQNGHKEVVEILLGRKDVNPDNRDNDGKTPLLLAAWYGHEGVVKLLLDVKRPTPTSEIMTAKHRPGLLSRAGGRG